MCFIFIQIDKIDERGWCLVAQYLNYGVYRDKMYGLNVLLAENKYKTIAMCTFSELSEGKRDKVFTTKIISISH